MGLPGSQKVVTPTRIVRSYLPPLIWTVQPFCVASLIQAFLSLFFPFFIIFRSPFTSTLDTVPLLVAKRHVWDLDNAPRRELPRWTRRA